jgi:DNA repair/transcription protein MET18/MMS19
LFATLVEALTPRLVAITFHSSSSSSGGEEDPKLSAAYSHALLAAIKRALAGKLDEGDADVAGYADSLVPVLCGLCVLCTCGTA